MSLISVLRCTVVGSSTCLRLKASSWRVRAAARSVALMISSTSWPLGLASGRASETSIE